MQRVTWWPVLLVMGVCAVGCASTSPTSDPAHVVAAMPAAAGTPSVVAAPEALPLAVPPSSPRAAVEQFLDAEISADFATSYASLSADDRASIGDATEWALQHATIPHYLSFTVVSADGDHVSTDTTIEPRVDEIVGVIAARATIDWKVGPERGGFTISLADTSVTPVYPDDSLAAPAAVRWADAAGQGSVSEQYEGTVLVEPDLVGSLKGGSGTFSATGTSRLSGWQFASTVVDALGPDAAQWARIVNLSGPRAIDVVVAPLGDHWVVVGVASR